MGKKIIILLLIVLAVGVFVFIKRAYAPASHENTDTLLPMETTDEPAIVQPSSTGTESSSQTATVSYGSNGFEPKTITIKTGETVTFVNESESGMWVASSKHPTHADYPEKTSHDCLGSAFDECQAVGAGESFSFTFPKKGTWGYHNHVEPNAWGTVVVE